MLQLALFRAAWRSWSVVSSEYRRCSARAVPVVAAAAAAAAGATTAGTAAAVEFWLATASWSPLLFLVTRLRFAANHRTFNNRPPPSWASSWRRMSMFRATQQRSANAKSHRRTTTLAFMVGRCPRLLTVKNNGVLSFEVAVCLLRWLCRDLRSSGTTTCRSVLPDNQFRCAPLIAHKRAILTAHRLAQT